MMKSIRGVARWLLPVFSLMIWVVVGSFFSMESETVYRNSLMSFTPVAKVLEDGIVILEDGTEVIPNEGFIYTRLGSGIYYSERQDYLVVPMLMGEVVFRYVVYTVASFFALLMLEIYGTRSWVIRGIWHIVFFIANTVVYTSMDEGYVGKSTVFWWYCLGFIILVVLFRVVRVLRSRKA